MEFVIISLYPLYILLAVHWPNRGGLRYAPTTSLELASRSRLISVSLNYTSAPAFRAHGTLPPQPISQTLFPIFQRSGSETTYILCSISRSTVARVFGINQN